MLEGLHPVISRHWLNRFVLATRCFQIRKVWRQVKTMLGIRSNHHVTGLRLSSLGGELFPSSTVSTYGPFTPGWERHCSLRPGLRSPGPVFCTKPATAQWCFTISTATPQSV